MDFSLDEIFNSVYLSEQESQAQHEYLQKLKNQIKETEKEAEETEKRCRSMQEEIAKKMQHLANREVMLLSMNIRQESLRDTSKEAKAENESLKKTQQELKAQLKQSREHLCKLSSEFIEEFGFFNTKRQANFLQSNQVSRTHQDVPAKIKDSSLTISENVSSLGEPTQVDGEDLWVFDIDFNKDSD